MKYLTAKYTFTGIVAFVSLLVITAVQGKPKHSFSDATQWSDPIATVGGGCPIETSNGQLLYTASGSAGTLDIWVYKRDPKTGVFSDRLRLEAPVSLDDANDFCPTPLNGHRLLFVSNRTNENACGGSDIYLTRYLPYRQKSFGPAEPFACAPDGPNTTGTDLSPSLIVTRMGTFLFYSSDVGGNQDIYVSKKSKDGSFGAGSPVPGVNTAFDDRQPNLSADGLTMVFASTRDDAAYSGGFDVFVSTRDDLDTPWSEPVNLSWEGNFSTQMLDETRPSLSRHLHRLYFGANGTVYQSNRD